MAVCWIILRGQQIYTVVQAVHSLLYIVAKCHFFSVVTWKDIIKYLQKCEWFTRFCEVQYILTNLYPMCFRCEGAVGEREWGTEAAERGAGSEDECAQVPVWRPVEPTGERAEGAPWATGETRRSERWSSGAWSEQGTEPQMPSVQIYVEILCVMYVEIYLWILFICIHRFLLLCFVYLTRQGTSWALFAEWKDLSKYMIIKVLVIFSRFKRHRGHQMLVKSLSNPRLLLTEEGNPLLYPPNFALRK